MMISACVILSVLLLNVQKNVQKIQDDSASNKPVPSVVRKLFDQIIREPLQTKDEGIDIEIDGLLIDDTRTKAGKEFYDFFYKNWDAPASAKNFTIIVSEKPFRFISTLITILVNDNLVFQAVIQPRQDIMEALAEQAIMMTQDYLANYEDIMKQLNGEDLSGSGIY